MNIRNRRRLLFFILIAGLLVLLFQFVRLPFIPIRLHEAVPNSTAVIFKFSDQNSIQHIAEKSGDVLLAQRLQADLDLFKKQLIFEEDRPFMVAVRPPNFDLLYVFENAKERLANTANVSAVNYLNKTINVFKSADNQEFSFSEFRNLTLVSSNILLVEEGVSQLKNYRTNLQKHKNFRRVNRTEIDSAEAYVYLNFKEISNNYASLLGLKKAADIDNFSEWVHWLKIGLIPAESGFNIEGAATGNLSFVKHLDDLKGEDIYAVLPDDLAAFTRMQAPLVGQFSTDFQKYFEPWISGEIAYANTEPFGKSAIAEKLMLIKSTDIDLAEKLLADLGDAKGKLADYDYQMFKIKQLSADDVLMPVFGKRLNPIKNPYYTVLQNFVVFSNSQKALENWLDSYIAGKTLSNFIPFLKVKETLSAEQKVNFTINFDRLSALLQNYLQAEYRKDFAEFYKPYEQFSTLSLSLHPSGQRRLFSGSVFQKQQKAHSDTISDVNHPEVAWRALTDSAPRTAPFVFSLPDSAHKIILTQTNNNTLYCFSDAGKKLWKRNLREPIISDIISLSNVDAEGMKLIFNTETEIFIINQNGENIDGYPFNPGYKITNGLCLIEYDDREDGIYIVAGKNKNIYAYSESRIPQTGWSPIKKQGRFLQPFQHFRTQDKDFIFAINEKGALKVYTRDGSGRFEKEPKIDFKDHGSACFDSSVLSPRIVVAKADGRLTVINAEGEAFQLSPFEQEGKMTDFVFKDVVGDARKDYVLLKDKTLSVYYYQKTDFVKAWEVVFDYAPSHIFSVGEGIGYFVKERGEIGRISKDGQLLHNQILGGNTPYVLSSLNSQDSEEIIVGCGAAICAYSVSIQN